MDLIVLQDLPNQLQSEIIYKRLNEFNLQYKPTYLIKKLNNLYKNTLICLEPIFKYNYTGKEYTKSTHSQQINTIIWQFGHIILFYLNSVIRLLKNQDILIKNKEYIIKIIDNFKKNIDIKDDNINYYNYFDSFISSSNIRYSLLHKLDIKYLRNAYTLVVELLNIYLESQIEKSNNIKSILLNPIDSYLIMLGILHNDMHYEAIIFTQHFFNYPIPNNFSIKENSLINNSIDNSIKILKKPNTNKIQDLLNIKFIDINGGNFIQGKGNLSFKNKEFIFDNEKPSFKLNIDDFKISKYPITEGQFLQFIENGGYKKKELWCLESWKWKLKYDINYPEGWFYEEELDTDNSNLKFEFIIKKKNWFKTIWRNKTEITASSKKPICNISWYEAKAFCKWANVRLPKESEWEYVATNGGTTYYPWGNETPHSSICNIDYTNGTTHNIDYYDNSDSCKVKQLIGNIWEWCEEVIYPYDGFVIDPVYREMSYPFFGEKLICRGGSWATSHYLISSSYRNAQHPYCRIQWIGFRVCLK
jgi:gamma-glutamyl hercynylcysteine S-oxide synthase